ncbi:CheY-like superfamily [Truncatella angustata]|uniref:CheY-like superfamily n=1 Tax=Truncatella angustata TaxID=152316 RepID=A0A9P8UM01_9PEZI|nr:CheY-like superfamily [Truncatella angustata]KAH6654526.1 CheY-like superfamily [Truncatella angustata]
MAGIGTRHTPLAPLGSGALAALGLIPPTGFSSVAIPVPRGSLYLDRVITTEPAPISSTPSPSQKTAGRTLPSRLKRAGFNGAFTLLIVNDNPVDRKIFSKICERWGQPYELAENGREAVEIYKREPERFRCILMDLVMPIMDGFEATRRIRDFEEESWDAFVQASASPSQARSAPAPVRRSVIVALVPSYAVSGLQQRIVDTGFDSSICRPYHLATLINMLFSGPGMNVVGLFGGVDDDKLREAGYPLQITRRKPSSIGEKEVGEALGRAVS